MDDKEERLRTCIHPRKPDNAVRYYNVTLIGLWNVFLTGFTFYDSVEVRVLIRESSKIIKIKRVEIRWPFLSQLKFAMIVLSRVINRN